MPHSSHLRVPLPRCLISLRVTKCMSLLPASPGLSGSPQSPAGAVPQLDGCAAAGWMRCAAVPGANGRGQPVAALRAGWKLLQQQQGMLSLCHGSALPSLSPPSHQWHAGCHSCHPCPAPGDSVSLGALCKDRRNFPVGQLGTQVWFWERRAHGKLLQGLPITEFDSGATRLCGRQPVVSFSPACPCCSSAHPCLHALAPQQRRGCSCSPQIHSLGNWGTPTPILRATVTLTS